MKTKLGYLYAKAIISFILIFLTTSTIIYADSKKHLNVISKVQLDKNIIEIVEVESLLKVIVKELKKTQIDIATLHEHIRQLNEKLTIVDFKLTQKKIKPELSLPSVYASFGKYHALIIGNSKYTHWPRLNTPENDIEKIAEILDKKYGFQTNTLVNATQFDILDKLNELRKELTETDNLLIYYAGHGHFVEKISRGYWIPVDGSIDSNTNWISTIDVSDILKLMSSKNIIVISDSCYSGSFTRSALTSTKAGVSDEALLHWMKSMSEKRTRTVLTSGNLKPVLDGGGGKHSVFAKALLSILRENNEVIEGQRLYKEVAARVAISASSLTEEQIPQYAPIRLAGHESGDFIFIPIKRK